MAKAKVHKCEYTNGDVGYMIHSPADNEEIMFWEMHNGTRRWTFNGDYEHPTFSPSMLLRAHSTGVVRSHFFVRDGKIEYLADSSHAMAGKTVDLPEFEF